MADRMTDAQLREVGNRLSMLAGSCDYMARQSPNAHSWPEYGNAARAAAEALTEISALRAEVSRLTRLKDEYSRIADSAIAKGVAACRGAKAAEARVERAEKVVAAALAWATDTVLGEPGADKRLAAALVEYERATKGESR